MTSDHNNSVRARFKSVGDLRRMPQICYVLPTLLRSTRQAINRAGSCLRSPSMTQSESSVSAAQAASSSNWKANAFTNGVLTPHVQPSRDLRRPEAANPEDDIDDNLPFLGKLADGTWGPYGIYGGRIPESRLLGVLRNAVKPQRLCRIEQVLLHRCKRVTCLFENLSDSSNGAACLRTMESFGLTTAAAVEAYENFHVSTGITKSADKWLELQKYRHCDDATAALKAQGYTLIATCLDKDAVPLESIDFSSMGKIALLFGNEERGLSKAIRQTADVKCYIEMHGFTQSFNVSVSCALMLMYLRNKGVIVPDLDDTELANLYEKWLIFSTKKTITLLKRHKLEDAVKHYM